MQLTDLFDLSFKGRRDVVGLEYEGADGQVRAFTFGDLDMQAARMAAALEARGLKAGDRLLVQLPNSVEFLVIFLACLRMGVIFVPVNVLYREREVQHIVTDSAPALCVVTSESRVNLPMGIAAVELKELAREAEGADGLSRSHTPAIDGAAPAALVYTSGTTGRSKGAVLSHNNFAANAMNLVGAWAMTSSDRYLAVLPLFHVHGLGNGVVSWLISGSRMRLVDRFDASRIAAQFDAFQPTVFFGVPTMYVRLLELDASVAARIGSGVRLFVSGSAPLPAAVLEAFREKFAHTILERYGMSETLMNISNPYAGERRAGTVGLPLPGVSVRVVNPAGAQAGDHAGAPVGDNTIGEVELRGSNVFSGYWNDPAATALAFRDGWFRTGDLAERSADGYYTMRGRSSDLIISGGFNIYPREIEEVILELEGVREVAVVGAPDPRRGEVPVAYVVSDRPLDEAALSDACKRALASFKTPRGFVQVESLPRTALGKVQKHLLPKWTGFLTLAVLGLAGCGGSTHPPAAVTFNKEIAPIVFANCASCHRPGGAAPFSLLTYAEVAEQAEAIATETFKGHMPPWLPERSELPIVGERRLRPDQIDAIQRWVKGGSVEGAAADRPTPPTFPDGWELGTPDLVVVTERPYVVKAGSADVYRNLVLKVPITEGVFVRAVEFRTNGASIHHAVIRVDRTSASRRRDGEDGQPGFDGMAFSVRDPDGQFIGWAPGRGPILSPEGMAWRLERGSDLIVELHVIDSKEATALKPSLGLFLTRTPPRQRPVTVRMASKSIDIPAGKADYVVTDEYELPANVTLLSVYPHAHYLGREMRATATFPDGSVKTLLHIPRWDFHWQQDYRYATPVALPRGTKLQMRYTFDNSAANPDNPHTPPVRVQAGPRAVDEMAEFSLQLLTESASDALRLLQDFDRKDKLANVALGETRARDQPGNAEYRGFLGGAYVEVGRFAEAIPHLEAALKLGDKSSSTHNYLGVAAMSLGKMPEAVGHFRHAVAAAPRDEVMHFNLGTALSAMNRPAEAEAAFKRSIAANPEYPDAHQNLATLLLSKGRVKEALPRFQRAVDLNPDSAISHSNLGGALASAGRFADAMPHIRRALEIDPTYAPALDNLRKLQQMGIR